VTYACSKVASVHFVADIAPDGMQATAQGIVSSVAAVGKLLGTSLGGYVEETYGSDVLYRGAAVLLSIVLSAFVAALYTNRRSRSII
jgi:predicted MFS family arabinose efflux permease